MTKVIEVDSTKEFANTFFNDIFFRMAVNRVLDAAPSFDLVHCKECFANGCCCIQIEIGMGEEGFCSKGRKEPKNGKKKADNR